MDENEFLSMCQLIFKITIFTKMLLESNQYKRNIELQTC